MFVISNKIGTISHHIVSDVINMLMSIHTILNTIMIQSTVVIVSFQNYAFAVLPTIFFVAMDADNV